MTLVSALTLAQREQLRAALLARQQALLDELGEFQRATLAVLSNEGPRETDGNAELAERHGQHTVGDAEASRDHAELVAVRAALARLADGSYGECTDCRVDVGFARLLAQPAAKRCVACQETQEQRAAL